MRLFPIIEVCVLTAPGPLNSTAGSLFVVATPIGNLDDISARALKVLRDVKLIAAEDTRHSQRLMQHFGISTPLAACHEHNEREEGSRFITRLLAGDDVAFLNQAGHALRNEIESLNKLERSRLPVFRTLQQLNERYFAQKLKHPGVDGALLCISQLAHYIE